MQIIQPYLRTHTHTHTPTNYEVNPLSEKSKRVHRLAELIQTVIAQLLQREVNDPRLNGVTITGVDLSPDGKKAMVFFSLLNVTDENIKLSSTAFQHQ